MRGQLYITGQRDPEQGGGGQSRRGVMDGEGKGIGLPEEKQ